MMLSVHIAMYTSTLQPLSMAHKQEQMYLLTKMQAMQDHWCALCIQLHLKTISTYH